MRIMSRITSILCTTLVLLPAVLSEKWIGERGPDVVFFAKGIDVPAPIKYNGTITKTTPILDGRSLVESWLRAREFICDNPAWKACSTQLGCCPTAQLCCPSTPYCKIATSDTCCSDYGTCQAGYECTSLCRCIETGGECCTDGNYCQKGNICVISPYGVYGCCTDLSCTAYFTGGVTVPLTPTYTPTQAATTPPPEPTITQGVYYYFTITWSYYFYYYYTFVEVVTTSTLTSSYTTVYTTVSVYGTNSAAASSSFNSISSAFVPSTPAAATTALAQQTGTQTGPTTSPAVTAAPTISATLFPTFSEPSISGVSSISTSLHAGGGSGTTGAGTASLAFRATIIDSWTMIALVVIVFIPGVVMLLL